MTTERSGWPVVTCSVSADFSAVHSLPRIGVAELHGHAYAVRAGWTHEINPFFGHTKPMQEMRIDLDELVELVNGKNLNEVLAPYPPTAETLACWLMANLPDYWQWVEVECYGGYRVRVEANHLRRAWANQYKVKA